MGFSLLKVLRSLDDFGHPIGVTYKGDEVHQSTLGGIMTIAV